MNKFNIFVNYQLGDIEVDELRPVICEDYQKVDDIRKLIASASLILLDTIFLIPNADKLNTQAQNALLKLAEEPPNKCYIGLITDNIDKLLPTIRSRANIITNRAIQETKEPSQKLMELAKKVYDNLGNISYTNIFNVLKHIDKEEYEEFLYAMRITWEMRCEYGTKTFDEFMIIVRHRNKVGISTNFERHIKTLLQELKEMRG